MRPAASIASLGVVCLAVVAAQARTITTHDVANPLEVRVPPAPTVQLRGGAQLPLVVLGTGSGQKGNVSDAVKLWLSGTSGVGLDCAYDYENENAVAAGMAASGKPRSAIYIETKIPCSSYAAAVSAIKSNLEQLGVAQVLYHSEYLWPHVNLTLIHFTHCGLGGSVAATWKALEEAKQQGLTLDIGVSHFVQSDIEALMKTATVKPVLNQCELSVVHHDDATMAYCATQGIVYQSFSPLCGGFNGSSCTWNGGKNVMTLPDVIQIAGVHNVSSAQIGLKWVVQQGYPLATAIWNLPYMQEDLDLWSWGNLSDAEMKTLSQIQSTPPVADIV